MVITGLGVLDAGIRKHARAKPSLTRFKGQLENCQAKNFQELKKTFGTVDMVGTQVIFDIGGNNFRLIATIDFEEQLVVLQELLTHEEYNKRKFKK